MPIKLDLFVKLNEQQVFKVICEDHFYENDKIELWILNFQTKPGKVGNLKEEPIKVIRIGA